MKEDQKVNAQNAALLVSAVQILAFAWLCNFAAPSDSGRGGHDDSLGLFCLAPVFFGVHVVCFRALWRKATSWSPRTDVRTITVIAGSVILNALLVFGLWCLALGISPR